MADERAGGSLKVSVVVPVYNPGAALDRSVASILAQTMPDDAFEAIFVDDGSTDGSGQRLDEIAAAHRHISVVHTAASGGPGRPRNIGLERARGEYVQFLDADDRLGERALDMLYEMGRRNGSDIVIGKLVSNFRGVHWGMFQRSYESCTVATAPLIENLTVSKMFRAAFIRENGIAFPEELRLTEDQYFVVLAYLRAKVVSVLADEPCYFYCGRDDGGNLSSEPLRPAEYCGNLRRILDMIIDEVEPGDLRSRLLRRFYRLEMLSRLAGTSFVEADPSYRRELFDAIRDLALDRIDDAVHDGLGPVNRLRSTLVRSGRFDDLVELAQRDVRIEQRCRVGAVGWASGRLRIPFVADYVWAPSGEAFTLVQDGDTFALDPRFTDQLSRTPIDVTREAPAMKAQSSIRERGGAIHWRLRTTSEVVFEDVGPDPAHGRRVRPTVLGTITVDPSRVGPGNRPLTPATWEVLFRVTGIGIDRTQLIGSDASPQSAPLGPALVGEPALVAMPAIGAGAGMVLEIAGTVPRLADLFRSHVPTVFRDGRVLRLLLPIEIDNPGSREIAFVIGAPPEQAVLPASASARDQAVVVHAVVRPRVGDLSAGVHSLGVRFGGGNAPVVPLGTARVLQGGDVVVEGLRRGGPVEDLGLAVRWDGSRAFSFARALPGRVLRRVRRLGRPSNA